MGKRISMKSKRQEAPQWVFSWKKPPGTPITKALTWLAVGAVFAFFLTSVRIHVTPPKPWAGHKAVMIQVTDDEMGRDLTLEAREGGPFPSRFEPSEWRDAAALEESAMEDARWSPPAYVSVLRDLPVENNTAPVLLARGGEPVLPRRIQTEITTPEASNLKLAPVLSPLSGITASEMPDKLPPFQGTVDTGMTSVPWRFLMRLDSVGSVRECVSLAGGNEAGPSPLELWLRGISFKPGSGDKSRWITLEVGFTNQDTHGSIVH